MTELKPCECGSLPTIRKVTEDTWAASCLQCSGEGDEAMSKTAAITAWNTRQTEAGEPVAWQRGPDNGVNCPSCGARLPKDYRAPCPDCGGTHPDPALAELRAEMQMWFEKAQELAVEITTLRAKGDALARYARHSKRCRLWTIGNCNCGRNEALSAWKGQNNVA